jgi:tryptophanase
LTSRRFSGHDAGMKTIIEPFRIKTVEPVRQTTAAERRAALAAAHWNLFSLKADDVLIDLLTDSGTGAMSHDQWAGIMRGDESYAGGRSFTRFQDTVRDIFGYEHVIPTHQGRAAERILFSILGGPGKVVPNNIHFDTTRANVEFSGATALDLVHADGRRPSLEAPFKGNIDLDRLAETIATHGPEAIPLALLTITNNAGGGQPVSFENAAAMARLCREHGIPFYFDACRFAENCWFIKTREPGFADVPVKEIARRLFALGDGCTMSAKKDGLANIGGFLATNDDRLAEEARAVLILTEGFPTYGGLAGRDLEAIAQGLEEVLDEDYLRYRIQSTAYLCDALHAAGVPVLRPAGGHAVFLDAAAFLPHVPKAQFPGQALACALYEHAGIRGCEIGSVMFGEHAGLELVRLAIPRRVYTQSHIDYVVEAVTEVFSARDRIGGMRITWAPARLRHFTCRFEPVPAP